ncbi:MAG: prepilin-type N-terminal cleavage/methylation domain-containing protein [Planctomycetota bacterium]
MKKFCAVINSKKNLPVNYKNERIKAYTLVELIVVVAIMAILLSIGIGTLSRISSKYRFDAAVSEVEAVIRSARNFAVIKQSPVSVHINPAENTIYTIGEVVTGMWHLEDVEQGVAFGALGLHGTGYNTLPAPGKYGSAREFGATPGLNVKNSYIDCGDTATLTPPTGLIISAWIFSGDINGSFFKSIAGITPIQNKRKKDDAITIKDKYTQEYRFTIVAKGASYYLRLTEQYALEFGFIPDISYCPFRTLDHVLVPNVWNHIRMRYNPALKNPGDKLKISVNGIDLSIFYINVDDKEWKINHISSIPDWMAKDMLPDNIVSSTNPLTISSKEESFFGKIDEVSISSLMEAEICKPKGAYLMEYPQVIHFGGNGGLDSEYHNSSVSIMLTEDPLYKHPKEIQESFVSRGGGIDGLPPIQELDKKIKSLSSAPKDKYKRATITISTGGSIKVTFRSKEESSKNLNTVSK